MIQLATRMFTMLALASVLVGLSHGGSQAFGSRLVDNLGNFLVDDLGNRLVTP